MDLSVPNLLLGDVIVFASGIIVGFVVGKLGFTKIEQDITFIKGLISGQQKVSIVPAVTATQGAIVPAVAAANTVSTTA